METKEYKYVIYEKEGNIARVILNKQEQLNTLDGIGFGEDAQNFYSALNEAAEDDDVKVVILKGEDVPSTLVTTSLTGNPFS